MSEKLQVSVGSVVLSASAVSYVLHEVYFYAALISALTGAILGVHGVYKLARKRFEKD